jgi:hypothetical protein
MVVTRDADYPLFGLVTINPESLCHLRVSRNVEFLDGNTSDRASNSGWLVLLVCFQSPRPQLLCF